jgi:tetratricopeptide (TPR) repeat protein
VGLEWGNREAGRLQLERLPPISEIKDVGILTFYLDTYGDQLTSKESLDLADRVIELTDDTGLGFSYGALKGLHSIVIGKFRDAERQISSCIEELRTANLPSPFPFVENRLAYALTMMAFIHLLSRRVDTQAVRYLREARYLYNKLLRETRFTALGEAAIYSEMAETYCFQADWKTARQYYNLAIARYQKEDLYKVLSAKCDIQLGDVDSAGRVLREIDAAKLGPAGYTDYAFQYAALALKSGDAEDVELAKSYLDKSKPRWPYFREERDRYKIALFAEGIERDRGERPATGVLFGNLEVCQY